MNRVLGSSCLFSKHFCHTFDIMTSPVRLCTNLVAAKGIHSHRFTDKVAIVTASTDGIGFAIAQRLAEEGASVMVSSRKQANVDRAVEQLKSLNLKVDGCVCHVGKADHRTNLLKLTKEKFGGIDIVVSNAAANPSFGPIFDTTEPAWEKIFDTNVKATFFLCKDAVPYMEERGGGSILIVTSIGGYVPFELIAPYSVSKTALIGLVKAMAPQAASLNIRVNGLAPGIVETKFSDALISNDFAREKVLEGVPLKRIGKPVDMAGPAAFLLSSDSEYMTGETMLVTGGMTARL